MDEALLKSGQFPNVAIMAGSDPKEVMREYGQTSAEHMDNGVSVHMCPYDTGAHSNISKSFSDTRKKLMEDVINWYAGATFRDSHIERVTEWLDRQAAITAASFDCNACADSVSWRISDIQVKVDELTAERDILKERVARFDSISSIDGIANLLVQFEDLTAERDQLKADLKTANDTINTLRASVAGLKETVEKLGSK